MTRIRGWAIVLVSLLVVGVGEASAQIGTFHGYATAFIGGAAGTDLPNGSFAFGGAVAVVDDSGWGADMDLSFSADEPADLLAFMVNLDWTKPTGFWRPYVSGGLGALRLHGCLSGCPQVSTTTDFGLNVGGGVYVAASDAVFVRGEVKYLWAPGDHPETSRPDNWGFFRATVGVTFTWTLLD
jgi:opacity protein-like surface antigen